MNLETPTKNKDTIFSLMASSEYSENDLTHDEHHKPKLLPQQPPQYPPSAPRHQDLDDDHDDDHDVNHHQPLQEKEETDPETLIQKRKHAAFVQALERYGSLASLFPSPSSHFTPTITCWEHMAHELNWPIEEVKLYAYQYLMLLQEQQQRNQQVFERMRRVSPASTPRAHMHEADDGTADTNRIGGNSGVLHQHFLRQHHRHHVDDHRPSSPSSASSIHHNSNEHPPSSYDENTKKNDTSSELYQESEWTDDECILMDTLLLAYEEDEEEEYEEKEGNIHSKQKVHFDEVDEDDEDDENTFYFNYKEKFHYPLLMQHTSRKIPNERMKQDNVQKLQMKWEKLAARIPGKTSVQIEQRYIAMKRLYS